MDSILRQLKQRRIALGLKQQDMQMCVGVSRQQCQRLESKGNYSWKGLWMKNEMSVLELTLHGRVVGDFAGFSHGRNVLSLTDEFRDDPHHPT